MGPRVTRAAVLSCLFAVGSIGAAGCFAPGPSPPVNTLCASAPTPAPSAQVALVAQGGTHPPVVKFQASTENQVRTEVDHLNRTGHVLPAAPAPPRPAAALNPP